MCKKSSRTKQGNQKREQIASVYERINCFDAQREAQNIRASMKKIKPKYYRRRTV